MEHSKPDTFIKQNTLFGLFVGISFILVSYLYFRAGRGVSLNPQLNNVIMLLSIAGTFIGVRKYREESLDGIISYGKALGACIYLVTVAAIIYGIYIAMLYHRHPELLENYISMVNTALHEVYGTSPLLTQMENMVEHFTTSWAVAFAEVFNKIFTGAIFSLLIAGLLRRNKKTFTF